MNRVGADGRLELRWHLAKKGAKSVLVSNRSIERAQELAAEFGGRAVRFDDCFAAMVEADIRNLVSISNDDGVRGLKTLQFSNHIVERTDFIDAARRSR